jgi:hypothetical protein
MTTLILENAVRSVSVPGAASRDRASREVIGVTGLFMDDAVPEIHDKRADNTARSVADRRRPGRQEYDTRTLIPLLRSPTITEDTGFRTERDPASEHSDLRAAAGIAAGIGLSLPIWAIIFGVIWLIF